LQGIVDIAVVAKLLFLVVVGPLPVG